jgi:photosystem I P700 chlorophyll a apoprotein A1
LHQAGSDNKALSKASNGRLRATSTSWIWNLHSDAHDFDIQVDSGVVGLRKVFSSSLAHVGVVLFWLGGMHFHGAYFSNYSAWLKDPKHCLPSAQLVYAVVGQDMLNSDVGGYFQGIYVTSGLFNYWRSEGILGSFHLKCATCACIIGTIVCVFGAYCHMHILWSSTSFYGKFSSVSSHSMIVLLGLGCISWCGHQIHISLPYARLLDYGLDPVVMPWPQELLFKDLVQVILPGFGVGDQWFGGSALTATLLNPSTGSLFLGQVAAHHLYSGIGLIGLSFLFTSLRYDALTAGIGSSQAQLSINLAVTGSLSIVFAHHVYAMPPYPYVGSDYPTMLCLFVHHMWIGGFLIVGAGAHASIFMVRDLRPGNIKLQVLSHRCLIIGHLIYVTIFLGLHSFGLYVHNDTLQALGRREDMFTDNSFQLKPFLAIWVQSQTIVSFDTEMLGGKVVRMTQLLGTADFMIHHIHAFTIHVTLLILLKACLYARSSRLVSDKLELGFRYPCDGPGRGGTCQISPYDHVYLAVFWVYNCISVVIFNYYWKMQSDVWGSFRAGEIQHIVSDFSVNSTTVNGWLRNFLWSQAAQVIQSYGTAISGYGLIFIAAHFIWAFSLMFLYSGRGYWQELIESILWAHHKLKVLPSIQPRALSISSGRAVGLCHYILGGIGCTWSFFISRLVALSS